LLFAVFRAAVRFGVETRLLLPFPLRRLTIDAIRVCHFLHKSYSNCAFAASDRAWTRVGAIARPEEEIESPASFGFFRGEANLRSCCLMLYCWMREGGCAELDQ